MIASQIYSRDTGSSVNCCCGDGGDGSQSGRRYSLSSLLYISLKYPSATSAENVGSTSSDDSSSSRTCAANLQKFLEQFFLSF